jgi:hypothetical protein
MTRSVFEIFTLNAEEEIICNPEQMGTKEKFWFVDKNQTKVLFKFCRTNTGEDWAEKIAGEIARILEIPCAHYELANLGGKPGVISYSILPKQGCLVLGNEILAVSKNYPKKIKFRNWQYTLKRVLEALKPHSLLPPLSAALPQWLTPIDIFIGYLLLDALIGNTDRHHENWGFIVEQNGFGNHSDQYLAETFDHASSLGRELHDDARKLRLTNDNLFQKYRRKCYSAFYASENDNKPLLCIDAFIAAASQHRAALQYWLNKLHALEFLIILEKIPKSRFSETAFEFSTKFLHKNQHELLERGRALI